MTRVNPKILRWARETAGLSLEEASKKLGIMDKTAMTAVEKLAALETGVLFPPRSLLVKMAKQYHRSLLVFYLSAPPKQGDRGQDFRTLPNTIEHRSSAVLDALIRDVKTRQGIIRASLEDEEGYNELLFVGSTKVTDGISNLRQAIEKALNFDAKTFWNKSSPEEAFTYLRARVEDMGIFVLLIGDLGSYHTAVRPEIFRGFAIADKIAPMIVINDQDAKTAWSFTLLHELAHIWLGETGISNTNSEKSIEQFCNDLAGELLLPSETILNFQITFPQEPKTVKEEIRIFANKHNLSPSMVAYRLFRVGKISKTMWLELYKEYQTIWAAAKIKAPKTTDGSPNYYIVRRHRVGKNLLNTVQHLLAGGNITPTKAGIVLGVKAKNVQKLMDPGISSKVRRPS